MKLYFLTKEEGFCQNKESIYDEMRVQGITEIQVYEAGKTKDNDFFYCKHFGEVGEKGLKALVKENIIIFASTQMIKPTSANHRRQTIWRTVK